MRKKSLMFFSLISLIVLSTVGIASNTNDIFAAEGNIINYTQTFDHLDEKNGQLGLTTKNGNFIKVNAPAKSANGLVELNNLEEFTLVEPIGGIISMNLEISVAGVTYPSEGLKRPYSMEFAYLVDPIHPETGAIWNETPTGYENEYIWGQGRTFETPSLLKFTSLKNELLIKKMTLIYNCTHLEAEDVIDQNAIYLLLENQPFPGLCANGLKAKKEGNQSSFYIDLYGNDEFYFKKPHGEKIEINLATDGEDESNAILKGYVSYNAETRTFTALKDIDIGIFIKDSGVTYVTFNKLIEQDWYVTGENLILEDVFVESCWGEVREDALMYHPEYWTFTYRSLVVKGGSNPTLLKLMSGDGKTYLGYDNLDNPEGIAEKDKDGNVKFLVDGTFRIDLYIEIGFTPSFVINKD